MANMATGDGKVQLSRMDRLSALMNLIARAESVTMDPEYGDLCSDRWDAVEREWLVAYHKVYG
jgi:hypothetical protein